MLPGLDTVLTPIHRAGWPFIVGFVVAAAILGLIWEPFGWLGWIATAWCIYFFRDPERVTPFGPALVIAPADGRVQEVGEAVPPPELGFGTDPMIRVGIFLNIFDVHVNRAPVTGEVIGRAYRPGKFLNASLDKASEDNERMCLALEMSGGRKVGVVQIAGLIARRIVCDAQENARLKAGQRFGMIRFGSRVDTWLPQGTAILVVPGQRAIGGETVLADLDVQGASRQGERR